MADAAGGRVGRGADLGGTGDRIIGDAEQDALGAGRSRGVLIAPGELDVDPGAPARRPPGTCPRVQARRSSGARRGECPGEIPVPVLASEIPDGSEVLGLLRAGYNRSMPHPGSRP